jgi:D-alanyl-lipoteichoic acid acyltransferase DltB (MBOAT superfamily)
MLTMLLGGLWHGASWKFMAWGGLHGVALAFDKLRLGNKKPSSSKGIRRILGIIFTFHFVAFCWIFFRADTFDQGIEVINQIANHTEWHLASDFFYGYQTVCWMVLGGMILHFSPKKVDEWAENSFTSAPILIQGFSLAFICWIVSQVASADIQPFIYFQF